MNTWGVTGLVSRLTLGSSTGFYTYDPSGNAVQRVNGNGTAAVSYVTDAFGLVNSSDGNGITFGFAGQFGGSQDSEDGFVLMGHRYYDPTAGRFLTRDPASYDGGINLYAYTTNNPINYADPDGLDKFHITNLGHIRTSQNANDIFARLAPEPTVTYNHQCYLIDIPSGQNLDQNLARARRFRRLVEDSGLSYKDQFLLKYNYLDNFCATGSVGDYGKNLDRYPDSNALKNNVLHWQRRLGANFNFGSMGGALGFSEETLLTGGNALSAKHGYGWHFQIEQDAIEDGFAYQLKH